MSINKIVKKNINISKTNSGIVRRSELKNSCPSADGRAGSMPAPGTEEALRNEGFFVFKFIKFTIIRICYFLKYFKVFMLFNCFQQSQSPPQ